MAGRWKNHIVYWAGPLVGSVVAAVVYRLVLAPAKEDDDDLGRDNDLKLTHVEARRFVLESEK